MRLSTFAMLAAAASLAAGAAQAATQKFEASLSGSKEVPANTTSGTGDVQASLDTATKVLSYKITFSGLTGPATMAHFHGPAAPGANAPPVVPIAKPSSPTSGTATLTDAQMADLQAGKWYFNVHTAANPGGEIRGQVTPAK
jgi:hypothetical protein